MSGNPSGTNPSAISEIPALCFLPSTAIPAGAPEGKSIWKALSDLFLQIDQLNQQQPAGTTLQGFNFSIPTTQAINFISTVPLESKPSNLVSTTPVPLTPKKPTTKSKESSSKASSSDEDQPTPETKTPPKPKLPDQEEFENAFRNYESWNHSEALEDFKASAAKGYPWAYTCISFPDFDILRFKVNRPELAQFNEKLAKSFATISQQKNDLTPAQKFALGCCYRDGIGTKENRSLAISYYEQAASAGNASAQNTLGNCYQHEIGVSQDYALATKFYKKSADQGNASAQNNLGFCYEEGIGVEQDHEEALKYYQMSADQGNAPAQYNLGTVPYPPYPSSSLFFFFIFIFFFETPVYWKEEPQFF